MQIERNEKGITNLIRSTDGAENIHCSSRKGKEYAQNLDLSFGREFSEASLAEKGRQHWSYVKKLFQQAKSVSAFSLSIHKPLSTSHTWNCRRNPLQQPLTLNHTKETIKNIDFYKKNLKLCGSERKSQENFDKHFLKSKISWSSRDYSDGFKENEEKKSSNLSKRLERPNESQIVWSSSNESDDSNDEASASYRPLQRPSVLNHAKETFNIEQNIDFYEKNLKLCGSERIGQENWDNENFSKSQISWSSSNESDDIKENEKVLSLNLSKRLKRPKESQIVWSSSNEAKDSNDETSVCRNSLSKFVPKTSLSAECELGMFVEEIKKDMRRTYRRKQKIKKKESLLEESRTAIERGKSKKTFFNYEEETGILKGLSAVIMEINSSYGVCAVNAKLENGNQCFFLVRDGAESMKVGTSLVSFVDYSKNYVINGVDVFIQPNKIVDS